MSNKGVIILEISLKHEVDSKFLANFYNSILDQIDDIYTEINIFNEQKKTIENTKLFAFFSGLSKSIVFYTQ